jgi:hypothetical protein
MRAMRATPTLSCPSSSHRTVTLSHSALTPRSPPCHHPVTARSPLCHHPVTAGSACVGRGGAPQWGPLCHRCVTTRSPVTPVWGRGVPHSGGRGHQPVTDRSSISHFSLIPASLHHISSLLLLLTTASSLVMPGTVYVEYVTSQVAHRRVSQMYASPMGEEGKEGYERGVMKGKMRGTRGDEEGNEGREKETRGIDNAQLYSQMGRALNSG